MKTNSRKSQIAIFLILGIVMIMVVVSIVLLTRHAAKKTSKQETTEAKEALFDIQPVKNFVTECLSKVSKNGLQLIGSQGGYIFKSQGGTLIDYQETDEGLFFIRNENSKVVYNILIPRFPIGIYSPTPPNYPWKEFPYKDDGKSGQTFQAKDAFGISNLPALTESFGAHSMQEQLESYVANNIDACLDFSVFEERGLNVTRGEKKIQVDVNQDDTVFRMEYFLEIDNLASGEKTDIRDFFVRHNIRLGKIHQFVNKLIESDISDIRYSIANNSDPDFSVEIAADKYNKDDIVTVTDKKSFIDSFNYNYIFARKNRNPALFYLHPSEIRLPAFDPETNEFQIISNTTLLGNQQLFALDPDEDAIDAGSFSIEPETPITLVFPRVDFKISVTDNEMEDYEIITVIRG